jgi:hypothetical protein
LEAAVNCERCTPREPLTRYRETGDGLIPEFKGDQPGERWLREADVEARDQAREAEIRELIANWRNVAPSHSDDDFANGQGSGMDMCADELEALLTPPQEREGR